MRESRHFPWVLAGMKQIDDLDSAGQVLLCNVPDPFGSVRDHDFLFGARPTASPGFQINSVAELAGGLDRSCLGGGIGIANGIPFVIPRRLSKDAAEPHLAGVRRLPVQFAGSPRSFFFDHENTHDRMALRNRPAPTGGTCREKVLSFSMRRAASAGNCPLWQRGQRNQGRGNSTSPTAVSTFRERISR